MKNCIRAISLLIMSLPVIAVAQHENDTWYFGDQAGIKFINGNPVVVFTNDKYGASTSISDKNTGDLLFFTDGRNVWDKNGNYLDGGSSVGNGRNALIVPVPGSATKYYIVIENQYAVVDMSLNGGLGKVIQKKAFPGITSHYGSTTNIVRHAYKNGYWVTFSPNNEENRFVAVYLDENGPQTPVITYIGPVCTSIPLGAVMSHDGKKLVMSYVMYDTAVNAHGMFIVYDFDKVCGTFSNPVVLKRNGPLWHTTPTMGFSPDNSRLYIEFYNSNPYPLKPENVLMQFHGPDFGSSDTVLIRNGIRNNQRSILGPDGRVYLKGEKDAWVDVIEYPNNNAKNCGYKKDYLFLGNNRMYRTLPVFFMDFTKPGPSPDNPGLDIKIAGICPGDTTKFDIRPPLIPDSVKWDFGDLSSNSDVSSSFSPAYTYPDSGTYTVTVRWFKCSTDVTQTLQVKIRDFKGFSLGHDTVFCHKGNIRIGSDVPGAEYTWSTGSNTPHITVDKPGKYWVTVGSGVCKATDTINIKERPPILIELGGDYAICDDDNELVTLDAGKGFEHYKWTPTGDTTQWIIVKKAGDYFVVVEDYRGCKGDDGSRINRLCDFTFYLPNAFTPDGNGLNDIFVPTFSDISNYNIEVFNVWGEKVFASSDPSTGWDGTYKGKACPIGAYIWKVSYKGYHNRLFKNVNDKGVVHLVR